MIFTVRPIRQFTLHGYTRLVRTLRVALPVTAILVLAIVFIWPHLDPAQAPSRHADSAPPEMTHSHFAGLDKHNRPYNIVADKAVQKNSERNDVDMVNPVANIVMQSGTKVSLSSEQGEYRENPGVITLEGNVRLIHDKGYEMDTSAATINLDESTASGDQPTTGHGARGDISAQGFRLVQDGDKIIFTGQSRLLLLADEGDNGDDAAAAALPISDRKP